jgi:hypothetical protein
MMLDRRKPAQKILPTPETREPKSIRFEPSLWARITACALSRGTEPSALARELAAMGLTILEHPAVAEAYMRSLAALHVQAVAVTA